MLPFSSTEAEQKSSQLNTKHETRFREVYFIPVQKKAELQFQNWVYGRKNKQKTPSNKSLFDNEVVALFHYLYQHKWIVLQLP